MADSRPTRRFGGRRLWIASAATAAVVLPLGFFWQQSLLPDTYDMAAMGVVDWGGGPVVDHGGDEHAGMAGMEGTAVADLTADPTATPDVSETLTVHVDDGDYTVNGRSPGPLLEATEGDLVEVTLVNDNVADGITLHWHGVDVPNAADGVAGVTQDAVAPGEEFVYRFVADQVGTFWYHSHQVSHEQVQGGLLGALVIHPAEPGPTSAGPTSTRSPSCTATTPARRSTARPARAPSPPSRATRCDSASSTPTTV